MPEGYSRYIYVNAYTYNLISLRSHVVHMYTYIYVCKYVKAYESCVMKMLH